MAEEKKIIIDEDWKEEAQREKEALAAAAEAARQSDRDLPPEAASFASLVSSLATQALVGLGELEHPLLDKKEVHLAEARFHIDLLEMLAVKTQGNLTDPEKRLLDGLLFDLRMRFVEAAKAQRPPAPGA
ncbi:MAG TPA: DUF1844 domain-containing protein [Gemmatales bacterium]|nr:DUF1844 domain-containing protein [Gemmatales bacterium]HMP61400.1 DUF1844 domain-containing protein [Gemmatales bacterium]